MRNFAQKSVAFIFAWLFIGLLNGCASKLDAENPPTDFERGDEVPPPWGCLEARVFGREVDC